MFSRFYRREKMVNRTLEIDEELYEKLNYLSKNVYDASVNKLVNSCIEDLIQDENVQIYKPKKEFYISRSFLIRESFLEGLCKLKKKYRISIYILVNIAIKNAIDKIDEI